MPVPGEKPVSDFPNLKRLRIASEEDLVAWLATSTSGPDSVMLVTWSNPASPHYVSRQQVRDALAAHDWVAGPRYTLNASQLGHVIHRRTRAATR